MYIGSVGMVNSGSCGRLGRSERLEAAALLGVTRPTGSPPEESDFSGTGNAATCCDDEGSGGGTPAPGGSGGGTARWAFGSAEMPDEDAALTNGAGVRESPATSAASM